MGNTVENIVRLRRSMLWSGLVGYTLFLGALMADKIVTKDGLQGWIALVEWTGTAICVVAIWKMIVLMKMLRASPTVTRAVCDELWLVNRYKAASFAFYALLPVQGIFVGVSTYAPNMAPPATYAYLNILIGFGAFVGSFLYLDHAN